MEEKKRIAIPEDVVNPKAYLKFLAYDNHPALKNTLYVTSEGEEVNIAMLPHRLKKYIEHLSPKEQEEILEKKSFWLSINSKRTTNKALAFGRAGCLGGKPKDDSKGNKIKKLSPFEEDIMELLGRMFTIPEVVKILGEDNGIMIDEDDVRKVLKKHIVEIERKREEYRSKVTDVRLYNKRPRLDELGWMYSKMKARYIQMNSIDAYNCMLRTLEQIRKEAEGDILNINGALDVNIEVSIQNHIQKEMLKTINLKEIILGRVAARMNFSLGKLIAGLHNSYYAKFVDIGGDYDPNAEMVYPSTMAYDFAAIERNGNGREVQDIKAEEITDEVKSKAQSAKDRFLQKIRSQKEDLEKRQANYDIQAVSKSEAEKPEEPIQRERGHWRDFTPPSKEKRNANKVKNKDYYTGEKKKK